MIHKRCLTFVFLFGKAKYFYVNKVSSAHRLFWMKQMKNVVKIKPNKMFPLTIVWSCVFDQRLLSCHSALPVEQHPLSN